MIGGRREVCGMNVDGPVEGVFVDFYGTIVAGDLACIEGICAKVILTVTSILTSLQTGLFQKVLKVVSHTKVV